MFLVVCGGIVLFSPWPSSLHWSLSPFFFFHFRALLLSLITTLYNKIYEVVSMNQMFGTNLSLKHDIQQQPFSFFSVLELIDLCMAIALFGSRDFF